MKIDMGIRDTVRIRIKGNAPERILERMRRAGMSLYDVSRRGDELQLTLQRKDFFRLPPLLRGSGCRLRVIGRKGPLAKWHIWRWRRMFLAGLFLFILLKFVYILRSLYFLNDLEFDEK